MARSDRPPAGGGASIAARPDPVVTPLRGRSLLQEPELNKGTAFSLEERRALGLVGLLPHRVETLAEQCEATRDRYDQFDDDLQRHVFLRALEDTNEVLFYAFLERHLTELLPIIYTPTVGVACQRFSHIYRRPHGLFLSYPNRGGIRRQLDDVGGDIDVVVLTDGERILGLGDQGLGGMGIPIGKLALYTVAGGFDPRRTLPVLVDVGTNNEELLGDPMYLGWRHPRVRGEEYDGFVDEVVEALSDRFPGLLLQWEDIGGHHAQELLNRYRHRLLSFNDDIQGTAVVAIAAIMTAIGRSGRALADHRTCIVGAGAAGCGIAGLLREALRREGVDDRHDVFLVDVDGIVHEGRQGLTPGQRPLAAARSTLDRLAVPEGATDLEDIVAAVGPTILVGVSGQGGLFTERVVRAMAAGCDRPIVLPMSNPTSNAEAVPADLLDWTGGRAMVATGSPFTTVARAGASHTVSQANNVHVFPGLGQGALAANARHISDRMLLAAADALAGAASAWTDGLLPPIDDVKQTSREVARSVARCAVDEDIADRLDDDDIEKRIEARSWEPRYPLLCPAPPARDGGGRSSD